MSPKRKALLVQQQQREARTEALALVVKRVTTRSCAYRALCLSIEPPISSEIVGAHGHELHRNPSWHRRVETIGEVIDRR